MERVQVQWRHDGEIAPEDVQPGWRDVPPGAITWLADVPFEAFGK